MERRLAAILAADLVGYSRLMGADEEGTLTRLNALRGDLVDPAIAKHRGRIVKTTGDGFLAEFASAVDAVNCAVSVQQALAAQEGKNPLQLRIGINVGDVIFERDDFFGDGVNIAARLEGIATPGGICISRTVWDHLGGKAVPGFRAGGSQTLKNIARPVEVWRWDLGSPVGSAEMPEPVAAPLQPAIAVLPFDNMSGDPEQGYFADGLAEDLITLLSKLAQLTVIARNSSFSYKGRSVKVQDIARDLGITHLVEGSVRKAGNRVRVTAQLIDCRDGGHVWAEKYDRNLDDIFEVQDEVTREIVKALEVKLAPGDDRKIKAQGTASVQAYDLYLKGREAIYLHSQAENARAQSLLRQSRALDPNFAPSAAYLALSLTVDYISGWGDDPEAALEMGLRMGQEAVRLDPSFSYGHITLGNALMWLRRMDEALAQIRQSIEQDPNFADGYGALGWAMHFAGQAEEGIGLIKRCMQLDPNYAAIRLHWLGQAQFHAGRFEDAAESFRARLARQPHSDLSRSLLASALGHLGQAEQAREEWAQVKRVNPDFSVERRRAIMPYKNPEDFEMFPEGLRKAGIEV